VSETKGGASERQTSEAPAPSKDLVWVPTGTRWQGTDWRSQNPWDRESEKVDLGDPGSVRDDVVQGLRKEFIARGVPDANSSEFVDQVVDRFGPRRLGVMLDVDGPLAPKRLAIGSEVNDEVRRLGSLARDGLLGGVSLCSQRPLDDMGGDLAEAPGVDLYCVSGLHRLLSGRDAEVDPVLVETLERYGRLRDDLWSDGDLLDLLVSDRAKVANYNPVTDPERLRRLSPAQLGEEAWHLPKDRARDFVVPLDYADPRHQPTIEAKVREAAERHGITELKVGDGLVRVQDATLKAHLDKGAALKHWAPTRRLDAVIVVDDVDGSVAVLPSEGLWNGPNGPGVLCKVASISPEMRKERPMAEAADAFLYGGPESTARFLRSVREAASLWQ